MAPRPVNRGVLRRAWAWLTAGPVYPPTDADLRTFDLVGLHLPIRATVAITVTTFVVLFDYTRTFLPDDLVAAGRSAELARVVAWERAILFGLVPALIVLVGFRDRLSRYGVTLGDWRAGSPLLVAGLVVMTPIVLWFATLPDAQSFYAATIAPLPDLLVTNTLDLVAAEFLFRGFLMFTLIRLMGPIGVLVATLPFVFAHIGKPELELLSTLGGGLVYGWLAWRTSSIVWGAIGHVYILTLVTVAAASSG